MKKKTNLIVILFVAIISLVLMILSIKGDVGAPLAFQNDDRRTIVSGPYESSGSTSRYALTEALVKNGKVSFTKDQAKFASPDLVYFNGKFFTIFTPGVSFLGVPLYVLGSFFGIPQIGAYATVTLFALVNIFFIAFIARRLGAGIYAGLISGITFAFATNAFAYTMTYTQHIMGTSVLLLSVFFITGKTSVYKNIALGVLFGAGLLLDIPNVFLLSPIILFVIAKHFSIEKEPKHMLRFKFSLIALLFGLLPLLFAFTSYNHELTGSYTRLGQFIGRVDYEKALLPEHVQPKDVYGDKLPFNTRILIPGFYTLLLSDERSWLFYSPIVLLGLIGFFVGYRCKKTQGLSTVLIGVVTINILLYAMFGDPWGGWGFGPRYLIPSASIFCIMLALAIEKYGRNILFIVGFISLFAYSIYVNVVGVLTTTQVPPKNEVLSDKLPIPWTFQYNFQLLDADRVGSLLYNTVFRSSLSAREYSYLVTGMILMLMAVLYLLYFLKGRKIQNETS